MFPLLIKQKNIFVNNDTNPSHKKKSILRLWTAIVNICTIIPAIDYTSNVFGFYNIGKNILFGRIYLLAFSLW